MINISHLSKAEAFRRLFNGVSNGINHPPMIAIMQKMMPRMTLKEAEQIVGDGKNLYFDYVDGRCMKVDLSKDEFNERLYDRDSGEGAAARALADES